MGQLLGQNRTSFWYCFSLAYIKQRKVVSKVIGNVCLIVDPHRLGTGKTTFISQRFAEAKSSTNSWSKYHLKSTAYLYLFSLNDR